MSAARAQGKIVVGVDGSKHAARALSWALEEARLRGLVLNVVYVFPALVSHAGPTAHEYYPQVEKEAEGVMERVLAAMPDHSDVDVERTLVPGNPSAQLVEASREAKLLVVGSRGLGEFRGMLLGSVSIHCVQQAHCPVVVVREED
ncbi:MAG TPA: universal stress protein [Streptosporangiaceae bacterium]|nr:universal stress protein [Streptosporangiaceae bacterium]